MMQIKMDSGLTLTHFCKRLLVTGKKSPKKYAAKRFAVILYPNTNRRTPPQINPGDFCYRACQQGTGNSFPSSPLKKFMRVHGYLRDLQKRIPFLSTGSLRFEPFTRRGVKIPRSVPHRSGSRSSVCIRPEFFVSDQQPIRLNMTLPIAFKITAQIVVPI